MAGTGVTYYTYLHCKPDGTPFYVGKGRDRIGGRRSHDFLNGRNQHHRNVVAKYGRANIGIFVFPCESEIQAFADEIQQITQLRAQGYRLANRTDGSKGLLNPTDDTRLKMSLAAKARAARGISDETRAKLSAASKGNKSITGQKRSPEAIAKTAAANKGNTWNRGRKHSPETCAKRRLAAMGNKSKTGYTNSPEHTAKIVSSRKGKQNSVEHCAAISRYNKTRWQDPLFREKMSLMLRARRITSDQRRKVSAGLKRYYAVKRLEQS